MFPKARSDGVVVEELDGEILVYDLKRDRAHRLNRIAAALWRRCDGKATLSELAASLETPHEASAEIVLLALHQLSRAELLERPIPFAGNARISRREMARRIGLTVLALPIITSIAAPAAAQGASCAQLGGVCGSQAPGPVGCNQTTACCPGTTCKRAGGGSANCTCA